MVSAAMPQQGAVQMPQDAAAFFKHRKCLESMCLDYPHGGVFRRYYIFFAQGIFMFLPLCQNFGVCVTE